jgi:hypothetical protein
MPELDAKTNQFILTAQRNEIAEQEIYIASRASRIFLGVDA